MRILPLTCTLALVASSALAELPYSDNRSTPSDVVRSLYNAINRHEYLRAWSYYKEGAIPDYPGFAAGYTDTAQVEIKLGTPSGDAGAGSIHSQIPVALRATSTSGKVSVFVGCYDLTQVQPAVQEVPPFRPIQIDRGQLKATSQTFAKARGQCD